MLCREWIPKDKVRSRRVGVEAFRRQLLTGQTNLDRHLPMGVELKLTGLVHRLGGVVSGKKESRKLHCRSLFFLPGLH